MQLGPNLATQVLHYLDADEDIVRDCHGKEDCGIVVDKFHVIFPDSAKATQSSLACLYPSKYVDNEDGEAVMKGSQSRGCPSPNAA